MLLKILLAIINIIWVDDAKRCAVMQNRQVDDAKGCDANMQMNQYMYNNVFMSVQRETLEIYELPSIV